MARQGYVDDDYRRRLAQFVNNERTIAGNVSFSDLAEELNTRLRQLGYKGRVFSPQQLQDWASGDPQEVKQALENPTLERIGICMGFSTDPVRARESARAHLEGRDDTAPPEPPSLAQIMLKGEIPEVLSEIESTLSVLSIGVRRVRTAMSLPAPAAPVSRIIAIIPDPNLPVVRALLYAEMTRRKLMTPEAFANYLELPVSEVRSLLLEEPAQVSTVDTIFKIANRVASSEGEYNDIDYWSHLLGVSATKTGNPPTIVDHPRS
ncbi:hypothetical protein H6F43_04150 [Leptolyngbya sp. FACHB-36]|uniref:hypothetical protein n=1 Tax=Leptolyngbya sp. FACHB-36 TaxID=2692808 RepID=UPI001680A602|nr:hypothetical protein [Leptolyngbya sp. FACHB-36]MBD2019375.1 hypothetical protein [Leptolyngbya sp. FACHB-36]